MQARSVVRVIQMIPIQEKEGCAQEEAATEEECHSNCASQPSPPMSFLSLDWGSIKQFFNFISFVLGLSWAWEGHETLCNQQCAMGFICI